MFTHRTPTRESSLSTVRFSVRTVARVFWVGMLALHICAILNLISELFHSPEASGWIATLSRLAGLSVSSLFFLLKLLDVAWLRLNPGRRSMIASFGVIALLHVGVVQRGEAVDFLGSPIPAGAMCLIGGAVGSHAFRRVLDIGMGGRGSTVSLFLDGELTRRRFCEDSRPRVSHFIWSTAPPRAPPISCLS